MNNINSQTHKKIDRRKNNHKLYYIILGIIGFSSLGQYIIFNILKFPFYLVEIYFIPFFVFNKDKYLSILKRIIKKRIMFIIMIYFSFIIMLIGIFYTSDPVNVITMSRSIFYIIILIFMFSENLNYSIDNLQIIASGAIIGEFINALFLSSGDTSSLNSPALALMIIIPIVKRKYIQFMFFSIFGLIVAINSGFRMSIISALVAICVGIFWDMFHREEKRNIKKLIQKIVLAVCLILILFYIKNNFITLVYYLAEKFDMSSFAIFRVTTRLIGLFELDFSASQDIERLDVFSNIITEFDNRILPRGLVGKSIDTLHIYIDAPLTYLYDAFGSIGTIVIVALVVLKGLSAFINSFKPNKDLISVVCGLMFPIYLLLLAINGSFLYITYQCIITGVVLGNWFKIKGRISRKYK